MDQLNLAKTKKALQAVQDGANAPHIDKLRTDVEHFLSSIHAGNLDETEKKYVMTSIMQQSVSQDGKFLSRVVALEQ